ncbi:Receptor-interacting serine/threonine-protein kinase 2 [Balamuthia mandrillaris]
MSDPKSSSSTPSSSTAPYCLLSPLSSESEDNNSSAHGPKVIRGIPSQRGKHRHPIPLVFTSPSASPTSSGSFSALGRSSSSSSSTASKLSPQTDRRNASNEEEASLTRAELLRRILQQEEERERERESLRQAERLYLQKNQQQQEQQPPQTKEQDPTLFWEWPRRRISASLPTPAASSLPSSYSPSPAPSPSSPASSSSREEALVGGGFLDSSTSVPIVLPRAEPFASSSSPSPSTISSSDSSVSTTRDRAAEREHNNHNHNNNNNNKRSSSSSSLLINKPEIGLHSGRFSLKAEQEDEVEEEEEKEEKEEEDEARAEQQKGEWMMTLENRIGADSGRMSRDMFGLLSFGEESKPDTKAKEKKSKKSKKQKKQSIVWEYGGDEKTNVGGCQSLLSVPTLKTRPKSFDGGSLVREEVKEAELRETISDRELRRRMKQTILDNNSKRKARLQREQRSKDLKATMTKMLSASADNNKVGKKEKEKKKKQQQQKKKEDKNEESDDSSLSSSSSSVVAYTLQGQKLNKVQVQKIQEQQRRRRGKSFGSDESADINDDEEDKDISDKEEGRDDEEEQTNENEDEDDEDSSSWWTEGSDEEDDEAEERRSAAKKTVGLSYGGVKVEPLYHELSIEELKMEPTPFAKGAFGKLYKAHWHEVECAVKVLNSPVECEKDIEEFRREATLMEKLGRHPNVVTFYGAGSKGNPLYLVMEHAKLGSMYDLLVNPKTRRDDVPWRVVVKLLLDVARGISYLHRENVIHRDLAARNILVQGPISRPVALVADFGLSRVKSAMFTHASTSTAVGAVKYVLAFILSWCGVCLSFFLFMFVSKKKGGWLQKRWTD